MKTELRGLIERTQMAYTLAIVMNYEDTDAGGVVYYGKYLAYMERARGGYLRQQGFALSKLAEDFGVGFVVAKANVEYLAPARLDDEIEVDVCVASVLGSRMQFLQSVRRGESLLVIADIEVVTIDSDSKRPKRVPEAIKRACMA